MKISKNITLSTILLLLFFSTYLIADEDTLWLSKGLDLLKLSTADSTEILGLSDENSRTLVIDHKNHRVFRYGGGKLTANDTETGEALFSNNVPLKNNPLEQEILKIEQRLKEKSYKGKKNWSVFRQNAYLIHVASLKNLYLAIGNHLYQYNEQGELITSIILPNQVKGMIWDEKRQRLLIGTIKKILIVSNSLKLTETFHAGRFKTFVDIAFDEKNDEVWVISNAGLYRFSAKTQQQIAHYKLYFGQQIVAKNGHVLVSSYGKIQHYYIEKPAEQPVIVKMPWSGRLIELVIQSEELAWIASERSLIQIDLTSEQLEKLQNTQYDYRNGKIRAVALQTTNDKDDETETENPLKLTVISPQSGKTTTKLININGFLNQSASVTLTQTAKDHAESTNITLDSSYQFTHPVTLKEGVNTLTILAKNNSEQQQHSISITLDSVAPNAPNINKIKSLVSGIGQAMIKGDVASVEPLIKVIISNTNTGQVITTTAKENGGFELELFANPQDKITVLTEHANGNQSSSIEIFVESIPDEEKTLPPSPEEIAPIITPETGNDPLGSIDFIFKGKTPIQTGVEADIIKAKTFAVVRGKVFNRQNKPLAGVTITIANHPEYGQTISRADGL
ncbi:MAG: hypothetical protein HN826_01725, partial [Methylococcales bacterium]|nr:hypothetical protein [Methylococcales bacterium]